MIKYMTGLRELHMDHPDWDDGLFVEVEVEYTEWPASYDEQAGWEIESVETVGTGSVVLKGTPTWHRIENNFCPEPCDTEDQAI